MDTQDTDDESDNKEEPTERRPATDYLNEHLYSYDVNKNNEETIEESIVNDGEKNSPFLIIKN